MGSPLKPSCWFRYVDDIFVIWSHGEAVLADYFAHLNNVHPAYNLLVLWKKGRFSNWVSWTYYSPARRMMHWATQCTENRVYDRYLAKRL